MVKIFLSLYEYSVDSLKQTANSPFSAAVNDTAGAVGVAEQRHWYIAIVNHGSERTSCLALRNLGYESYVPTQGMTRRYASGRKKRTERLVLPAKVFVRTTEEERLRHIVNLPFIFRFMTDPARRANPEQRSPVAIIPDRDMDAFRLMLGQEEFPVTVDGSGISFSAGDKVRVAYGSLAGLEGLVRETADGGRRLYVSLDILGSAFVEIDSVNLEPVH